MAKKVLVAEQLADAGLAVLRERGCEVDVRLDLSPEELVAAMPAYDALVVRSGTQVTREVIDAAPNLRVIGRAGMGVDNVDVAAATERGIIVCNAPTSNIVSAAEHALALMLACARNVAQANASMHEGKWERSRFTGVELYEKTLAIFGLGRVGGLVAERARAFGMKLVGYDPYCSPERAEQLGVKLYDTVDEIVPLADFITVHLPKTEETIGMFGPDQYAAMKDGVILVNAARGGIYNVDSLADFLAAGKIGAVGLDVYESEPCTGKPAARVRQRHPDAASGRFHQGGAAARRRADGGIRGRRARRLRRAHGREHGARAARRAGRGGPLRARLPDDGPAGRAASGRHAEGPQASRRPAPSPVPTCPSWWPARSAASCRIAAPARSRR